MKTLKVMETKINEEILLSDEKELVMAIVALQHLYNENTFNFGSDIFITTISTVSGIVMDNLISKVIFAVFASTFTTKLVIDTVDKLKIRKLKNELIKELVSRYDTPQMAYLEIAQLITSLTREEIIRYLNSIGCEVNAK